MAVASCPVLSSFPLQEMFLLSVIPTGQLRPQKVGSSPRAGAAPQERSIMSSSLELTSRLELEELRPA